MVTLSSMNTRLRELIKSKMKESHVSQLELAERLNVATSHVSRIISGDRGTTLENLMVIADALKIDRTYFLRVAAGLNPDPEKDEWVEEQDHKLRMISPKNRTIAGKLIDTLVQGEESELRPKPKAKPAKA